MKTTLNIPDALIKEAMRLAKLKLKTETVRLALEELIKQKCLEEIIAKAGTLKFSADWDKARHDR